MENLHEKYGYQVITDPVTADNNWPKLIVVYTCMQCGEVNAVRVDKNLYYRWYNGELLQNVWPQLSPEERDEIKLPLHAKCNDDFYEDWYNNERKN